MMQTTDTREAQSAEKDDSENSRLETDSDNLPTFKGLPIITDHEWQNGSQTRVSQQIKEEKLPTYPTEQTALDINALNTGVLILCFFGEEHVNPRPIITLKHGEITIAQEDGTIVTRLKTCRLLAHALHAYPQPLTLPASTPGAADIY